MMDFDQPGGVTLVGWRPFHPDASPYTPPCYDAPQCMDIGVSSHVSHGVTPARTSAASLPTASSMSAADMISAATSPASASMCSIVGGGAAASTPGGGCDHQRGPPPYDFSAAQPSSGHYDSPNPYYGGSGQAGLPPSCMHGPYTPTSPAMSITTTPGGGPDLDDLEGLEGMFVPHDPVPMLEPVIPEEPPNKIKRGGGGGGFYSGIVPRNSQFNNKWASSCKAGSAQQLMAGHDPRQQFSKRGRSSSKHSTRPIIRTKSPLFPVESTPLTSISRQPSISSISSSTKSDPFSTPAMSVRSDPGVYRHVIHSDSGNHSPAYSLQDSPRFVFAAPGNSTSSSPPVQQPDNASRSCLELEMPAKYSRKISEIDKKILELQAKRSKLLEKVHSEKGTGPVPYVGRGDFDNLWMNVTDKSSDIGKVLLYIFPLGIREFDEPVYEEANAILRQVGGMYFDLQKALSNLRDMCCKGSIIVPEISTCFAYIRSLLHASQRLKLTELTKGIYRIQLDSETGTPDGPPIPHEFYVALNAANDVLMSAQHITQSNSTMQLNLQQVRQRASEKIANFETICNRLEIVAGDRKNHIKSVLEGYRVAIASAERVWPQYYHVATDTISTITECIHPSAP